jgi:hypothetical protein
MDEPTIRHLEMIQGVINRMAANSFHIKSWAVVLATAILGFSVDQQDAAFSALAIAPVAILWGLDAYYLRRERLFRSLFNYVRTGKHAGDPFTLDIDPCKEGIEEWPRTLFASTIWPIYLALFTVSLVILLIFLVTNSGGAADGSKDILQLPLRA